MLILGHRGYASRQMTENTLPAFRKSLDMGAEGIEFDVRVSRDGELVIVHDQTLSRIAGDGHAVAELTADELAKIPLRHGGSIGTLLDVTSNIHAPYQLDMEVKDVEAAEALIRKLQTSQGLRERTIVSSFHEDVILRIRQSVPDVRTLVLHSRWPLPLRGPAFWTRMGQLQPWALGFPARGLNAKRVQAIRDSGFKVAAWDLRGTVREAKRIQALQVDVAIVKRVEVLKNDGQTGI